MSLAAVAPGDAVPAISVDLTPTFVVTTALAGRDLEEVHHDPATARERGSEDIFLNILTTQGLVVRLVTDWAGPAAVVRSAEIRLGTPAYAGDRLVLSGEVTAVDGAVVEVAVRGRVATGDHVTGTVRVELPTAASP